MSGSKKLTRKQERAIDALLATRTQEQAATVAGVSTATLRRWLADPAFVAVYRAARRRVVESAIGRLQYATAKAVSTLTRNLRCGNPAVEIRAAATILQEAVKGVELTDLVAEVEKLKALFAEREGKKS